MSDALIDKWENRFKVLYSDILDYINVIEGAFEVDSISNEKLTLYQKKYKKQVALLRKYDFKVDGICEILETLKLINGINQIVRSMVDLVSDDVFLKNIEQGMSNTFYQSVLSHRKRLVKMIDECENLAVDITKEMVNSISDKTVLETSINDFERMYINHISTTSVFVFNKCIELYKLNKINVNSVVQKMYDYILGYLNEPLNKNPYCSHPLLLMGLSFNLKPQSFFISQKDVSEKEKHGLIKINNVLKTDQYMTFYNLGGLLNGKYLQVVKKHSINPDTIFYSRTIENNIINNKKENAFIKSYNLDHPRMDVYESLDGGNMYRSLNSGVSTSVFRHIDKGPRPRVYLYNAKFLGALRLKGNSTINKTIKESKSEYVDVSKLMRIDSLSEMYDKISSKSTKHKEKLLYELYKADTYLKEIRKLGKNSEPKIPFTEPLMLNLF